MKRCPQCEFIYEDDQSLCDMDGILLVFDSLNLPKPNTTSTLKRMRNRVVPALAALVLGTVLFLVYYVSTHRRPTTATLTPAAVTSTPAPPIEASTEAQVTGTPAEAIANEEKPVEDAEPSKKKEASESNSKTGSTVNPKEAKPKPAPKSAPKTQSSANSQQDESKLGNLFKKTGKLLKKPFKL